MEAPRTPRTVVAAVTAQLTLAAALVTVVAGVIVNAVVAQGVGWHAVVIAALFAPNAGWLVAFARGVANGERAARALAASGAVPSVLCGLCLGGCLAVLFGTADGPSGRRLTPAELIRVPDDLDFGAGELLILAGGAVSMLAATAHLVLLFLPVSNRYFRNRYDREVKNARSVDGTAAKSDVDPPITGSR